jgi:hypothetical protein
MIAAKIAANSGFVGSSLSKATPAGYTFAAVKGIRQALRHAAERDYSECFTE